MVPWWLRRLLTGQCQGVCFLVGKLIDEHWRRSHLEAGGGGIVWAAYSEEPLGEQVVLSIVTYAKDGSPDLSFAIHTQAAHGVVSLPVRLLLPFMSSLQEQEALIYSFFPFPTSFCISGIIFLSYSKDNFHPVVTGCIAILWGCFPDFKRLPSLTNPSQWLFVERSSWVCLHFEMRLLSVSLNSSYYSTPKSFSSQPLPSYELVPWMYNITSGLKKLQKISNSAPLT